MRMINSRARSRLTWALAATGLLAPCVSPVASAARGAVEGSRGPTLTAAPGGWQSAGPAGTSGVAISIADDGRSVWVANQRGQVFHSRNGGRRWSRTTFGGPGGAGWPQTVVADPRQPAAAWAAVDGALYRTEDRGRSWREVWSGSGDVSSSSTVRSVVVDPRGEGRVLVVYHHQRQTCLARTADGGRRWQELNCYGQLVNAQLVGTPDVLATSARAGADGSVWWWQPSLRSLLRLRPGTARLTRVRLPDLDYGSFALDSDDPERLWSTGSDFMEVRLSTDGGTTFATVCSGPCSEAPIHTTPGRPDELWAWPFGGGVRRSTDGGRTWELVSGVPTSTSYRDLAIPRSEPERLLLLPWRFYGPAPLGVLRSTDGGSRWHDAREGLRGLPVQLLGVDLVDPRSWYTGLEDDPTALLRSSDRGASWQMNGGGWDGVALEIVSDRHDPSRRWARTPSGLRRSSDGGTTWRSISHSARWNGIADDPRSKRSLFAVDEAEGEPWIYRSTDRGRTFDRDIEVPDVEGLTAIAVDPASARRISVAGWRYSSGPCGSCTLELARSTTDGGRSWEAGWVTFDQVATGTAWRIVEGRLERRRGSGEWSAHEIGLGVVEVLEAVSTSQATALLVDRGAAGFTVALSSDGGESFALLAGGLQLGRSFPPHLQSVGDGELIVSWVGDLYRYDPAP